MEIFRKIKPKHTKSIDKQLGHEKLGEGWNENKEAVADGLTFCMKYIGSHLVEETADGESYRDGQSEKAVNTIVAMAKTAKTKLRKVTLTTSPEGIKVCDMASHETIIDCSIFRISFCSADKNHDKIFAFMARNTINETVECHAFLCAKRKIAQAVTLTVSKAFELASDRWNAERKKNNVNAQSRLEDTNQNVKTTNSNKTEVSGKNSPIPKLQSPDYVSTRERSTPSPRHRNEWLKFEDDNLDDDFSRLAENRSRKGATSPEYIEKIPSFHTNLRDEDMDDSITQYLNTKTCNEEFSRQRSMEDLLVI